MEWLHQKCTATARKTLVKVPGGSSEANWKHGVLQVVGAHHESEKMPVGGGEYLHDKVSFTSTAANHIIFQGWDYLCQSGDVKSQFVNKAVEITN